MFACFHSLASQARLGIVTRAVCVASMSLVLCTCGGSGNNSATQNPTAPSPGPSTITQVTVSGADGPLNPGDRRQLTATAIWGNGTTQGVTMSSTWASVEPRVASISSDGVLTAFSMGDTEVAATYQGVTGRVRVEVRVPARPDVDITPPYSTYRELMHQVLQRGPVYVTAGSPVMPTALNEAAYLLSTMLRHRPDVGSELRRRGTLTAVFARNETSCDLPYFADLAGTSSCTQGGLGGVPNRSATACAERNLLQLPEDPFRRGRLDGENVCVHELAHTIMNIGLSDHERQRIRARYASASAAGIWAGDFAMVNADEFFAEMTQAYFCANPQVPTSNHMRGINCASALREYDRETFELLEDLFRGAADLR